MAEARLKVPCRGCGERTTVCHSDCERYLAYRAERERLRLERVAQNEADSYKQRSPALNAMPKW